MSGKKFVPVALAVWAVAATILAAVLLSERRERPAPRATRSARGGGEQKTQERKRQRRRPETAEPPAPRSSPPGQRAGAAEWVARYRKEGADRDRILAQLEGLSKVDPQAHLALLRLIRGAEDPDEIDDILSSFPQPRTGARDTEVTAEILATARTIVRSDSSPHRRVAAADILLGYERPRKEDYLWALGVLRDETQPLVREALVTEISHNCSRLKLTDEEARPFLEQMRRAVKDGVHCVNSFAHWSGREADFALVVMLADRERDPNTLIDVLSAFRAGVRLTRGREDRAFEALLRVAGDPLIHRKARRRALQLLETHKPWGKVTAEAVRRFRAETDSG